MPEKPTYEELKQRVRELEKVAVEHKRTAEALRESGERYRQIFNIAPAGIYEVDFRTGKLVNANEAVCEYSGYTKDELFSMAGVDLLTEESQKKLLNRMNKMLSGVSVPDIVDYDMIRKDGSVICINVSNRYIYEGENIVGATVVARDITDHKRSNEALRESWERIQSVFRAAPTGIGVVVDRVLTQVNERVCEMTGYSEKELIGQSARIFYPSEADYEYVGREKYKQISKHGTGTVETHWRRKDGGIIDVLFSSTPINFNDLLKGVTFTALDISECKRTMAALRESKERLMQAQKMESIGTLAGGIVHDFNNLLFPIIGCTEMLMADIPADSPLRKNLNMIFEGAMRAKELVKQILAFSRQDSNEIKLMRMQSVLKETLKLIRSTIPTSIEITQCISNDCGPIKADPTQIHQVVMNLATNAYHAMEDTGGKLTVNLKEIELCNEDLPDPNMEPGSYACLTVTDTGSGISEEVSGKIFDPYFTTKKKGKGTGMGLSVIHGIVTGAEGGIKVYSKPGCGTEFNVYLPVVKSSYKREKAQIKEPFQLGSEQILLVDDDAAIASMGKQMLERLGYSVVSHTSSVEALKAFRADPNKFDLVITDMAMPNMSGDKLASELTKIRSDIPIVLCTGFSENMPEEKAKSMGIKGFLMKPRGCQINCVTAIHTVTRSPKRMTN